MREMASLGPALHTGTPVVRARHVIVLETRKRTSFTELSKVEVYETNSKIYALCNIAVLLHFERIDLPGHICYPI